MPDLVTVLRADPGFGELTEEDLTAFAAAVVLETCQAGEPVSGEDAFALVLDGEASVTVGSGSEPTGEKLRAGQWLGGFAGIDALPPGARVTADSELRLARFARSAYRDLHDSRPAIRVAFALSLGSQLARRFRAVSRRAQERLGSPAVLREAVTREYDVVVIGGGPHGIAYATWIKQDRPETSVAILEKRSTPGFKIGESTLGPVIRAGLSLGLTVPVWRRLFNNKLGLHFWWMGEQDDRLHNHFDQVVEETFQLERRVFELLMLELARRAGVEIHRGTKVLIEESRIDGQPKEIVAETEAGDVLRMHAKIVCDASGPAAVIGRHRAIRHKNRQFNTNAYFGYFRQRADAGIPDWDVPATRHLCFPEGWVWFIELASWQGASEQNLSALIDHLLELRPGDEDAYPTRLELAERFECPLDQWPVSIGVVPRADVDTARELPVHERFGHYVDRYPALRRIMATHELIPEPYPGHPPYLAYTDLVQHSDRYAGDGWLLVGDAAFFVNPLYSPGMTYGHSVASLAARETVSALERGDFSERAFATYDEATRTMCDALVADVEMMYRSFVHPDSFERCLLYRLGSFIGLQHPRILQFGGVSAMQVMRPIRPHGPMAEAVANPTYVSGAKRIIATIREREAAGASPDAVAQAVRAIVDPALEEIAALPGVQELGLGRALRHYDDSLQRVPDKGEEYLDLVPVWRCGRCANNNPLRFDTCFVCGDPPPTPEAQDASVSGVSAGTRTAR
jgi:flavin-dependent dehydrogenase